MKRIWLFIRLLFCAWQAGLATFASAATIEGNVICNGAPTPTLGLVVVQDKDTGDEIGHTFFNQTGEYSLDVPDDFTALILAMPVSGRTLAGWQLGEYLLDLRAVNIGTGTKRIDLYTEPALELILIGQKDKQIVPEDDYGDIFITDQSGRARPLIDIGVENPGLGLKVPGYLVPLGESFRIFLLWELPHAGKVVVSLDNGGRGFSSSVQDAVLIEVNLEIAVTALALLEADIAEAQVPTDEATQALAEARQAFDELDYDQATGLAVVAAEELALRQALYGIERYRKGDLLVSVVDADGDPVPEAQVQTTQRGRDFRFGIFDRLADAGEDIFSRVFNDGIDFFTAGVYWPESEPEDDQYQWDYLDHDVGIVELSQLGFLIKGHPLIWLLDIVTPDYLRGLDYEQLTAEIAEHIGALVGRYKNTIRIWDVINEVHGWAAAGGWTREQITSITREAIDQVHDLDPGSTTIVNCSFDWYGQSIFTELFIPDHDPSFTMAVPDYIQELLNEEVDLDVIGQQMYNGGCVTIFAEMGLGEPLAVPTFDLGALARMLNRLNEFGLPVHLTEQSAPSAMDAKCPGMSYWRDPWTAEVQADYLESFYTLVFGSKAFEAITWWSLIDEGAFIKYGGLFDKDKKPKAAYERLVALIASWTSQETDLTGQDGEARLRLFGGEHKITATLDSYSGEATVKVPEQKTSTVQIVLEGYQVPETDDDDTGNDDDDDDDAGCGC